MLHCLPTETTMLTKIIVVEGGDACERRHSYLKKQ